MSGTKSLVFLGTSRDDLRKLPADVRRAIGGELQNVQEGLMPTDFKPMPSVGQGVFEIRVRLKGAWRVMYVAKFEADVYVLHVFQKKTQKTSKEDLELAARRYRLIGA